MLEAARCSFFFCNIIIFVKDKKVLKEYKKINSACKFVGFEIVYPSRYIVKQILVEDKKVLKITFSSLTISKQNYYKEFSFDNVVSNEFKSIIPNNCYKEKLNVDGIEGIYYWNGSAKKPKIYLSLWNDSLHSFIYTIYSKRGINLKNMSKWQKILK